MKTPARGHEAGAVHEHGPCRACDDLDEHAAKVERERFNAVTRAQALAAALEKYGRHKDSCELATIYDGSYIVQGLGGRENRRCTCGFRTPPPAAP